MGLLIIDHSACTDPVTGKQGEKLEFDTVSCGHCQALIRLVIKGVKKAYETPYRCARCKLPMCRHCAEVLGGECDPLWEKINRALKTGVWGHQAYVFKTIPAR